MSKAPTGKVIGSLFTLLVLGGIGLPALGTSWDSMVPQETHTLISGTVLMDDTVPEVLALVTLYRFDGDVGPIDRVETDQAGYFEFDLTTLRGTAPVPGDYLVELAQTSIPEWNAQRRVTVVNQSEVVDFRFDHVWVLLDRENERLSVDKDPLYIIPGHTIQWTVGEEVPGGQIYSLAYPLAVHFPALSPLTYRRRRSEPDTLDPDRPHGPIIGQVRARILPGKYSYFVAVYDPVSQIILTEDPEIIDENGDDPGGGKRRT